MFPVFNVRTMTRRRNPVYPGAVVGKPPQEDKWIGIAAGEIVGPLIRVINPSIRDLSASADAVFHNLLVVSMVERHPKEALKVGLNLLGTGQLSLTKVTVLVREDVPVRSFPAMLRNCGTGSTRRSGCSCCRSRRSTRWTIRRTSCTSGAAILDATGPARTTDCHPRRSATRRVRSPHHEAQGTRRGFRGGDGEGAAARGARGTGEVGWTRSGSFVAAVSDDVDLDDESSVVWGIFTRFDPARDMIFEARSSSVPSRYTADASASMRHGSRLSAAGDDAR